LGQKSEKVAEEKTLGTGVIIAHFHWVGTVECKSDRE